MKLARIVRRSLFGGALAAACFLLAGCVKDKVLVKVNKDGSGQIVVTRLFPRETAEQMMAQMEAMMQGMAMSMGGMTEGGGMSMSVKESGNDPFFNEKSIKKEAKSFGPGVRYVKAKPVRVGGTRGYVALYQFKDINDVKLDLARHGQKLSGMSEMQMMEGADEEAMADAMAESMPGGNAYGFRFTAGSPAKLIITTPGAAKDSDADTAGAEQPAEPGGEDEAGEEAGDMMEMMEPEMMSAMEGAPFFNSRMMARMFAGVDSEEDMYARMLKGMELSLVVEVDGKPVKSTASYPDPQAAQRIVLLDVDMGKALSQPGSKKKMRGMNMFGFGGEASPLSAFAGMPGARVETNREVVVEFK